MNFAANPPWVDRVLTKHWHELEAKVGADMMPALESGGRYLPRSMGGRPSGKPSFKEFGCGHYGCVFPTWRTPGIVCKVTSDESERDFVRTCMEQGWEWPEGIVEYYSLAVLDDSHLKRPVSVLWRQEATDLGLSLQYWKGMKREEYERLQMARVLLLFRDVAGEVRDRHRRNPAWTKEAIARSSHWPAQGYWPLTWEDIEASSRGGPSDADVHLKGRAGVAAVTAHLQALLTIAQWMENESATSYSIGRALTFYLSKGILLADVHLANVGMVDGTLRIVDPGHAVFLGAPLEW